MTEQAGVYKIILYESKGLDVAYRPDGRVKSISNTGEEITLQECDTDTLEIEFQIRQRRSANNKSYYRYSINWKLLGLSNDNLDTINKIKSSIYKWVAVVYYYNNTVDYIANPFKYIEGSIDNNVSNHYNIEIQNTIFSKSAIDFVSELGYIFEDEADYIFEDEVEFIFE